MNLPLSANKQSSSVNKFIGRELPHSLLSTVQDFVFVTMDKDIFNLNPTSVAVPYHTKSVALSLTDTQFLVPIIFIPLKLGGSPFALTFLGI